MNILDIKINQLCEKFKTVLYEEDHRFLKNMECNNLAGDDIHKYRFWEWTQGVGIYGYWLIYKSTDDENHLATIENYYRDRFKEGLPSKNINTFAPMLTLACLCELIPNEQYLNTCIEWAVWLIDELPRTQEGGFQHITSDTLNDQELWDDTLFMSVLFLGKIGKMTNNSCFQEEAKYQFLVHIKYLTDKKTGLWYHGWTFNGHHNFSGALWGRGNCWITMAIPEFLDIVDVEPSIRRYLLNALQNQVVSLKQYQNSSGVWHTLIDDPTSYVEASATAGFGYGILKACRMGLLDPSVRQVALNALKPILNLIDEQGVLNQVSYGTAMGRDSQLFYKEIPISPMPYGQALALLFLNEARIYYKEDS